GRQEHARTVHRRSERHAFLGELAAFGQREHLEAAGVGEDRLVPADEAMQAPERADYLQPRPQPEMERIAEDDLRADVVEIARRHRFDGTISADRHERGRLDHAARQRDAAAAGIPLGGKKFELHTEACQYPIIPAKAGSHLPFASTQNGFRAPALRVGPGMTARKLMALSSPGSRFPGPDLSAIPASHRRTNRTGSVVRPHACTLTTRTRARRMPTPASAASIRASGSW